MTEKSVSNNLIQHKSFVCSLFNCQAILFDPQIGPYQMLQPRDRVDLVVMAIQGYSTFPRAPALLEPRYQMV